MLAARQRSGYSQIEVAAALAIRQSSLSEAEGSANKSSLVAQFARLYGCDPHWLATGQGEPNWQRPTGMKLDGSATAEPDQAAAMGLRLAMAFERLPPTFDDGQTRQDFYRELTALIAARPYRKAAEVAAPAAPPPTALATTMRPRWLND